MLRWRRVLFALLIALCFFSVGGVNAGTSRTVPGRPDPVFPVRDLHFPDGDDEGTGTLDVEIAPGALRTGDAKTVITASGLDISLTISTSAHSITIDLVRRGTDQHHRSVMGYTRLDPMRRHRLKVAFANWKVTGVEVDGRRLPPKETTV